MAFINDPEREFCRDQIELLQSKKNKGQQKSRGEQSIYVVNKLFVGLTDCDQGIYPSINSEHFVHVFLWEQAEEIRVKVLFVYDIIHPVFDEIFYGGFIIHPVSDETFYVFFLKINGVILLNIQVFFKPIYDVVWGRRKGPNVEVLKEIDAVGEDKRVNKWVIRREVLLEEWFWGLINLVFFVLFLWLRVFVGVVEDSNEDVQEDGDDDKGEYYVVLQK